MYGTHTSYHTSEMCASIYRAQWVQSSKLSAVESRKVFSDHQKVTSCKYSVYQSHVVSHGSN